jgi:hypothetical protein
MTAEGLYDHWKIEALKLSRQSNKVPILHIYKITLKYIIVNEFIL